MNVGSVDLGDLGVIYFSKSNEFCLYLLHNEAGSKLELALRTTSCCSHSQASAGAGREVSTIPSVLSLLSHLLPGHSAIPLVTVTLPNLITFVVEDHEVHP